MQSFHIEYFLALAKYKNFSIAAERLYISQPSLSKHIRSLEDELELRLFNRTHKGVELTPEGEIMRDYFERTTSAYHDTLHKARNLKYQTTHLTVALLENMDTEEILKPLFDFQAKMIHTHITFTFIQLPYREIFYYLQSGQADLAIAAAAAPSSLYDNKFHVISKPLKSTYNNLYFSVNHPAAKLDRPPVLEDFRDTTFFLPMYYKNSTEPFNDEYSIQQYFSDLLGYKPRFVFLDAIASILPNIESGEGAAILVDTCQLHKSSLIRKLPLTNKVTICLKWVENNDNELLKELIENCACESVDQPDTLQNR